MSVYPVEFLVDRLFDELSNTTKANANTKSKLSLPRPIVAVVNKKTLVKNFRQMCQQMNRSELDVQKFFSDELLKKTSVDSKGGLLIWGMFRQPGIEKITKRYITQFIICKECNASKTELIKEHRVLYLKCHKCLSKKAL